MPAIVDHEPTALIRPPTFVRPEAAPDAVAEHYHAHYRKQERVFRLLDGALGLVVRPPRRDIPADPRRILLINAGHIGDCIMSSALFPVVRHAYPRAEIGFLTGSYSRAVLEGHPLITRTHYLEHWRASRKTGTRAQKARQYYLADLPAMVAELRACGYDMAIDLHAWFPNSIGLMWRAGIPVRVGFDRVGGRPLLTHAFHHVHDRRNEIEHKLDLLRHIGVPPESLALARLSLPPVGDAARAAAADVVPAGTRYVIVHPASSLPTKDWTVEKWAGLVGNLAAAGRTVVVTGAGARDGTMAQAILALVPQAGARVINAVNRLGWQELMAVLAGAELVYSVDTSIGHAAAAYDRQVISIYGGMVDALHWGPAGARIVTNPLPCAPCFNKHGCAHRSCITDVTVADVEAAAQHA